MDRELREQAENKLRQLSRQFELVLRTTKDPNQKKRVSVQLGQLQRNLAALEIGELSDEQVRRLLRGQTQTPQQEEESSQEDRKDWTERFPLLAQISIQNASEEPGAQEINAIHSYFQHFENEYLPVLGSHQLKLDFSHSQRRDVYFNNFSSLQLAIKGYFQDLIDVSHSRIMQNDQADRMRQIRRKTYMDLIMKCGEFVSNMYNFLGNLLSDCQAGGNLILNPDDTIKFDEIHGERELNNFTMLQGVERIYLFLGEFAEYLNVPGYQ
ncbi:MAG: hypothetical protein LBC99_04000 [Spirochaetota bacterium]|jgi:hypothetical protein|nr:hypothetical protein [Spirochaetota bacterium]